MTMDDVLKTVFGLLLAALSAVVGWIVNAVVNSRDRILQLEGARDNLLEKIAKQDEDHAKEIKRLEDKLKEHEASKVTVECVREVLADELKKRDEAWAERRVQYDRLHALELEKAIDTKMDTMIPKMLEAFRTHSLGKMT